MIPGMNLLNIAMQVITPAKSSDVTYLRATGRTTLSNGVMSPSFADGKPVSGSSVQAVNRSMYGQMGLDYQKNYVTWFVSKDVIDLQRDTSGDRMTYAGRLYQLESETDWFKQDGWTTMLCVDIGLVK